MVFIHRLLWSARGWIPCREQPLGTDGPSNPPQNCNPASGNWWEISRRLPSTSHIRNIRNNRACQTVGCQIIEGICFRKEKPHKPLHGLDTWKVRCVCAAGIFLCSEHKLLSAFLLRFSSWMSLGQHRLFCLVFMSCWKASIWRQSFDSIWCRRIPSVTIVLVPHHHQRKLLDEISISESQPIALPG